MGKADYKCNRKVWEGIARFVNNLKCDLISIISWLFLGSPHKSETPLNMIHFLIVCIDNHLGFQCPTFDERPFCRKLKEFVAKCPEPKMESQFSCWMSDVIGCSRYFWIKLTFTESHQTFLEHIFEIGEQEYEVSIIFTHHRDYVIYFQTILLISKVKQKLNSAFQTWVFL